MDLILSIGKHTVEFIFNTGKHSVEYLLAKSPTFTTLHYYLVKHPKIQTFEWHQGQTLGSSFTFLALTVFLYLTLTFILSRRHRLHLPPPSMVRDTGRNGHQSENTLNGHETQFGPLPIEDIGRDFNKSENTLNGRGSTRSSTLVAGDTGRGFNKSENTMNCHETKKHTEEKLQSRTAHPPLIPPLSPRILRFLTVLHNTILLTVSFVMALGCLLSIFTLLPDVDHLACFAKGTPPQGPLFFWGYVFYLSKIYEYIDTLLIILSSSMSRRLSFLHVYHHATVVVMCYISLHTSQSMYPGVLVTNSAVHVVMYFYYLLCSLGMKPQWKKIVTDCQIVQFYISFGIMGWIFYAHFTGSGCSGIWGWCFDAVFIASLLYLFLDFHTKTYSDGGSKKKKKKGIRQVNGSVEVFDFIKPLKQA